MKDIIVVVADSYQEKVIEALLPRIPVSSGTVEFNYDIIRNINNDSGSFNDSHELLRPYINEYRFAIVVFDYEGCGAEFTLTREQVEEEVEELLSKNGWVGRGVAIVVSPEIENWMWIDNPNVDRAIGWVGPQTLYEWGRTNGLIAHGDSKPLRPKETLEKALRTAGTSKSSAIYRKIAQNVSYRRCEDPAFLKLLSKLIEWFGI